MRWPAPWLFGMTLAACAAGCRSHEVVESQLRARESDVRELKEELERTEFYNQALQNELRVLRGEQPLPDKAATAYPVRSLALGRQTGGHANEHGPGDDALQVMVEPRDPDNSPIKAPGSLLVTAVEVTPEGLKRPLSSWEVPPDELRKSWRSGLFNTGYSLTLPWKVWPSTEKMRVVVVFRMPDGRVFEADKDFTVRLVPLNQRPAVLPAEPAVPVPGPTPPAPPVTAPAPAREEPVLPPPRQLEKPPPSPPPSGDGPSLTSGKHAAHFTSAAPASVWHAVTPEQPAGPATILPPVPVR
jgi:hypothetical protein